MRRWADRGGQDARWPRDGEGWTRWRPGPGMTWLILAMVALALRLPDLGNPIIDLDEQMYLLVGSRMWDGALPYVDIWDRKPIGLFLIYAASQAFGGDPVVAYQLLALLAALGTAGAIAVLARRTGPPAAGVFAGAIYLVWIGLLGGRGGQAPVFYNLLIVLAALCCRDGGGSVGRWRGMMSMLLVGLALQVKPTAVFEGLYFGILLLLRAWRRERSAPRLVARAVPLVAAAMLPTLIAFAVYAAIGHGDAWWFANVRSIFLRRVTGHEPIAIRLVGLALVLAVPLVAASAGAALAARRARGRERWFLAGWLAVALAAVLVVPPYYNHYALPLVAPLAVAAGIAMAARPTLAGLVAAAAAVLLALSGYPDMHGTADARRRVGGLAALIERYRSGQGCVFLFQAPPIFYQATRSCLPTRYAFASHLTFAGEAGAIGTDPSAEVGRVLAELPAVIVTAPPQGDVNRATFALVEQALRRDYHAVGGDLGYRVFVRRPPAALPR